MKLKNKLLTAVAALAMGWTVNAFAAGKADATAEATIEAAHQQF